MQANNTIPANAMNQKLYPEACRSWDPFKKKFNNQFKDEIWNPDAQNQIMYNWMKDFKTCNEYTVNFEIYEKESAFEEQALLTIYKEGLNETLNNRLAMAENLPTTLQEWKDWVCRSDRVYCQTEIEKKWLFGARPSPTY